jgi:hypothetical protein
MTRLHPSAAYGRKHLEGHKIKVADFSCSADSEEAKQDGDLDLIRELDNGGLVYPAKFVRTVCFLAEEKYSDLTNGKPVADISVSKLIEAVFKVDFFINCVLSEIPSKQHLLHTLDEERISELCRSILRKFLTLRLRHMCDVFIDETKGVSRRNKFQRNAIYCESKAICLESDASAVLEGAREEGIMDV